MQANKRNTTLDIARGIAIISVVLGHSIQYTSKDFDTNLIFKIIYAAHMPLFMFISGFLAMNTNNQRVDTTSILKSNAKKLLLPFTAWIPINFFAIGWLQAPPDFDKDFLHFISQLIKSPDSGGLWFLLVLFECHLLLLISQSITQKYALWLSLALLAALNLMILIHPSMNWLGLGFLRWYFLFFLAGNLAKHFTWHPPKFSTSAILSLIYLMLATCWSRKSAVPVELFFPKLEGSILQLAIQGYHAATAFVGIAAILAISSHFRSLPLIKNYLQKIGNLTLELYAGHYIFLYLALIFTSESRLPHTVSVIIIAAIAFWGAIYFYQATSLAPIVRRTLFGR